MDERSKAVFIAFTGREDEHLEAVMSLGDGYECWNLNKMNLDEFVQKLQEKIVPVNQNVFVNYQREEQIPGNFHGISEQQYEKAAWGLLIPETLEAGGLSTAEPMFLINLFSPNFLFPYFCANDMGIRRETYEFDLQIHMHSQDHTAFATENFVHFYKLLFDQSQYATWHLDRVGGWNKEDWRLFVAALMYSGLRDYENGKTAFGWQRESAEMATILEAILTAGDSQNREVTYRLRKRIAALLATFFPDVESDIKKLYSDRSSFVHGDFFSQIFKDAAKAPTGIPSPDFEMLYKQKEYVRLALATYLNLSRAFKSGAIDGVNSVMDALEQSIIKTDLRETLNKETESLLSLMPEVTFKKF